MNETALMNFGIELVLKSTVLCGLAFGLAGLLRRASAASRCAVWNALFVGLLILPVLCLLLPSWTIPLPAAHSIPAVPDAVGIAVMPPPAPLPEIAPIPPAAGTPVDAPELMPSFAPPASAPLPAGTPSMDAPPAAADVSPPALMEIPSATPQFDWTLVVLGVYGFGVGMVLLRVVMSGLRLRGLERSAVVCTDETILDAAYDAASTLNITRPSLVILAASDAPATVPMTWGHRRPRLLLPADASEWSAARLRAVLLHEFAHLARADWLLQMTAQFACALFWFHPVVWRAARLRRLDSERGADDCVILSGVAPTDYAAVLLETARARRLALCSEGAISMAHTAHLSNRVQCLLDRHQSRRSPARAALLIGGVLSFAALSALSALRPAEADAPPPALAPVTSPLPPDAPALAGTPVAPAALALPAENLSPPDAPLAPAIAGTPQIPNAPSLSPPALASLIGTLQVPVPSSAPAPYRVEWSQARDGLQTLLRFVRGDGNYNMNEDIQVQMLIRNIAKTPRHIELITAPSYFLNEISMERLSVSPKVDAVTTTGKFFLRGRNGMVRLDLTLPPNETVIMPITIEPIRLPNWNVNEVKVSAKEAGVVFVGKTRRGTKNKAFQPIPRITVFGADKTDKMRYMPAPGFYTVEWDGVPQYRNPGQIDKQPLPQPNPLQLNIIDSSAASMMQTPMVGDEPAIQVGLLQPYLSEPGLTDGNPQGNGMNSKNGCGLLKLGQTFNVKVYLRNTSTVPMTIYTAFDPKSIHLNGKLRIAYGTNGTSILHTDDRSETPPTHLLTLKSGETVNISTLYFVVTPERGIGPLIASDKASFRFMPKGDGAVPMEYKLSILPQIRFEKDGKDVILPSGRVALLDPGIIKGTVRIEGMVAKPGTYPFVTTMTLRELLEQAGGIIGEPKNFVIKQERGRRASLSSLNVSSGNWNWQLKLPLDEISNDWENTDAIELSDKPFNPKEFHRKMQQDDEGKPNAPVPIPSPKTQTTVPAETGLARLLNTGKWDSADVNTVRRLLRQGADIRTKSTRGVTVLMMAAKSGDLSLMQAAIRGGVDVNARTTEGWTALDFVMSSRNGNKLRLLLDAGADPNTADRGGRTPLMMATNFKFRDGITLLLSRGANINARNSKGYTALAYTDRHTGIVQLLKDNGAQE
jgi:beta-lactamase regulating signal transducer with metallopeptidase domain